VTDLLRDVVLAGRRLRAAPAFTAFSVITLAVGIGMTIALFTAIRGTLLRPPDIADVHEVVNIYHSDPITGGTSVPIIGISTPDLDTLMNAATSLQHVTGWTITRTSFGDEDGAEFLIAEVITGEYFQLARAHARLGRTLLASDDSPAAPPVVVISESYWRRRFNGDPGIVGRVVRVNGVRAEIVGVIAAPFRGMYLPNLTPTSVWVTLGSAQVARPDLRTSQLDAERRLWHVKARLNPDVSIEQATAEVTAIARGLDRTDPIGSDSDRSDPFHFTRSRQWRVLPTTDVLLHESVHRVAGPAALAATLMGALVLLVACSNLANLCLARGAARRHGIAVQYAMGGSRWRIAREQLVESGVLSIFAGIAAYWIARLALTLLVSVDVRLGPIGNMQLSLGPHAPMLVTGTGATVLAFFVFGALPAIQLTRRSLQPALQAAESVGAAPRWRGRRLLIAGQVAVSVTMVAAALFSVQQVVQSLSQDTGLDLDRFAAAAVDFELAGYDETRARETLRRLVTVAGRESGVERVALSSGLPLGLPAPPYTLHLPGGQRPLAAAQLAVTPQIFQTIGVRLERGRLIGDGDIAGAMPVAVIDATAAEQLFGDQDPVGQQIVLQRRPYVGEEQQPPVVRTVIGVVGDTNTGAAGRRLRASVFVPFAQHFEPQMAIVVRGANAPALATALPAIIRRADPHLAVSDVGTGATLAGLDNVTLQVIAALCGILGVVALALAMSGLYGVLSFVVSGRRREIGVRRALGASSNAIVRLVIGDGLRPVLSGLLVGMAAGLAVRYATTRLLRSVPEIDLGLIVLVPALFIVAGVLAAYFPARRASRVDPSVALRNL
jgi:predicted permease